MLITDRYQTTLLHMVHIEISKKDNSDVIHLQIHFAPIFDAQELRGLGPGEDG